VGLDWAKRLNEPVCCGEKQTRMECAAREYWAVWVSDLDF
jgi:hypothetical protein